MGLTFSQLQSLWTSNGGNPIAAPFAAAVALAESGGNNGEVSPTNDYGLWQINGPSHPQYNLGSLQNDPNYNAKAAIAISNNGTNFRPWCTVWSDGACGTKGGSFLGAGSPVLKYANGALPPQSTASGTLASNSTSQCPNNCVIGTPGIIGNFGSACLISQSEARGIVGGATFLGGALLLVVVAFKLAGFKAPSIVPVPIPV